MSEIKYDQARIAEIEITLKSVMSLTSNSYNPATAYLISHGA